jgi:hypothetical protein
MPEAAWQHRVSHVCIVPRPMKTSTGRTACMKETLARMQPLHGLSVPENGWPAAHNSQVRLQLQLPAGTHVTTSPPLHSPEVRLDNEVVRYGASAVTLVSFHLHSSSTYMTWLGHCGRSWPSCPHHKQCLVALGSCWQPQPLNVPLLAGLLDVRGSVACKWFTNQ